MIANERRLVLVVEDDPDSLIALGELLVSRGHRPLLAPTGREALAHMDSATVPDVIVLDLSLPDITGRQILARKGGTRSSDVPVILASGDAWELDDLAELGDPTVVARIRKPFDPEVLWSWIEGISIERESSTPSLTIPNTVFDSVDGPAVLVVDDDDALRAELTDALSGAGYAVVGVENGRRALEYIDSHGKPSLILLDLIMPVMDGWELCAELRSRPELADVPTVLLSALRPSYADASMLSVAGFIEKPVRLADLLSAVQAHAR